LFGRLRPHLVVRRQREERTIQFRDLFVDFPSAALRHRAKVSLDPGAFGFAELSDPYLYCSTASQANDTTRAPPPINKNKFFRAMNISNSPSQYYEAGGPILHG
jgi:hypothetical protein